MTYAQVTAMIESIGLPWEYYQFDKDTAQAPPYVVYFFEGSDDLYADNTNYQKIEALTIELYSELEDGKDYEDEADIEKVLTQAGLTWRKTEAVVDTEQLRMVVYQMDVLIVGEDISE